MATPADNSGRYNAKHELVYVASSQPTVPRDPTDAAYKAAGLLINNPFDGTADGITASDKSTSGFSSTVATTRGYTVQLTGYRDIDGDDGQEIIRDAWVAGSNVYWLRATTTVGEPCVYGQASVTAYGEPSDNDDFAQYTATLSGQGAPTFGIVAT